MEYYTYKEFMAIPMEEADGTTAGEETEEYLKYRSQRRRRGAMGMEGGPIGESHVEEVDEGISTAARMKKSRNMKKYSARMKMGRKRAMMKTATNSKLKNRAKKQSRMQYFKKLSKGKSPSELPLARRAEIEKRLDKLKTRIDRTATKILPQVRKMEKDRKR